MKQTYCRTFLLAALALPAFAQDQVATTAAPSTKPVLVLKTAQAELAGMMARSFEHAGELPELTSGSHYIVSLGADHKVAVAMAQGDVGFVEVTGDPGALMDLFAEQVEAARPMLRGTLTVALQAQGVKPKEVAELVDSLFAFPKQMAQIRLKVVGDPEHPREKGLDVTFSMEPKVGAGFAAFVELLQPCSQGVPMLPAAKPMVAMQFSLEPAGLRKLLAPLRDVIIGFTNQGEEQRAQAVLMYDQMMTLYDGGLSTSFSKTFEGHMLMGVLDGDKAAQLMSSEAYLNMMKGQQMANRDIEIEVTPNAFEHRGAKVMKSKVTGEPTPMMPTGTMESFAAAVGNYVAISIGGGEGDAKAMIDAVADQKVKRAPLAAGAVLQMTMDLRAMVAMVQERAGGGAIHEDVPDAVTVRLVRQDKALQVQVHLQ